MSNDDRGVLGSLPRSRPGRRSDKRSSGKAAGGGDPRSPAAAKRGRAKSASAQPAQRASKRPTSRSTGRAGGARQSSGARAARPKAASPPPRNEQRHGDPVTGAFRLAGKVAEVGLKTAGGVLRRLPGR